VIALVLGLILSAGIGLSLGLIGGGGSIITVPMLVYVLGVPPHRAIGMSLAVVGATALVSVFLHHWNRSVAWRTGLVFAGGGIVSSYMASKLTRRVSPPVLMLLFAALMLAVATVMLTRPHRSEGHHVPNLPRELAAGFGVGAVTGFFGVGGGFLIVPALVVFGGLGMKAAVGTSLFVIAVNCAAGLLGHASQEGFDLKLTVMVTAMAFGGAVAGAHLANHVHHAALRRIFAWFVVAVALYLVVRNYNAVFR
jgi:uncharacterized protein